MTADFSTFVTRVSWVYTPRAGLVIWDGERDLFAKPWACATVGSGPWAGALGPVRANFVNILLYFFTLGRIDESITSFRAQEIGTSVRRARGIRKCNKKFSIDLLKNRLKLKASDDF